MNKPQQRYVLAIDLGTSGPKVAIVATTGEVLGWAFEPVPVELLPNGGAEQDPILWWQAICGASRRVLKENGVSAGDIKAVCCTAQWSGTVAVDRQGQPLGRAIIWMDTRGAGHIRNLIHGPVRIAGYEISKLWRWLRLTGGAPTKSGKDPLGHILFLKHERPAVFEQAHKFLEPKDWINHCLTGRYAASFDSIALHWVTDNRDLKQVRYDTRLLRWAGIPPEKLPPLQPASTILGPLTADAARALGLKPNCPVVAGTPDLTSAALGSGAVSDYEGHLYIGTSAWLTCHVPFKKTDLLHNMASLPSAIPGRYFIANEQETAGACLNFIRDALFFGPDELSAAAAPADFFKRLNRLAESTAAGSSGVLFTPWLFGERTPVENHLLRAGFHNIGLRATRADMARAVLEGVAYNLRWLLGYVEKFIRRPMKALNFIGGGAKSALWSQILADVLDRTVRQVHNPILANVRGAGLLGAAAIGDLEFESIAERVAITATYTPRPDHRQLYDRLYAEFLNLYRNNKGIYGRLNRR